MGFLSKWDTIERIDVSDLCDDAPGTWWIEVKKCLNHAEADEVLRELMRSTMNIGDVASDDGSPRIKATLSVDSVTDHQGYIVARSIVRWNLTDRMDEPLPTAPLSALTASLAELPAPVYDRVAKVVIAANTEKSKDTASFSLDRQGGDQDGQIRASNDREVLV